MDRFIIYYVIKMVMAIQEYNLQRELAFKLCDLGITMKKAPDEVIFPLQPLR